MAPGTQRTVKMEPTSQSTRRGLVVNCKEILLSEANTVYLVLLCFLRQAGQAIDQ